MDGQHVGAGHQMLIIGVHDGNLRLACESCGAHAIRSSEVLFWATRCHVCGEVAQIHGPRTRISNDRAAEAPARISFTQKR